MTDYKCIRIGSTDCWDVYLKRMGDRIVLKRYHPLDYEYMQQYIDENVDILGERQSDVYNWRTESGYDEWRQDYEYQYWDYFRYDTEAEEYFNDDDSDTTWDDFYPEAHSREDIIEMAVGCFDENYLVWNFEWVAGMNEQVMREKIGQYYDECMQYLKELEEKRKPHWNVFNYYK